MRSDFDNIVQTTVALLRATPQSQYTSQEALLDTLIPSIAMALLRLPEYELFRKAADIGINSNHTLTVSADASLTPRTRVAVQIIRFIVEQTLHAYPALPKPDANTTEQRALKFV